MPGFDAPQWEQMFAPDLPLAESFLRGTLVFFVVLVLFRVVLKRQSGGLGAPDVMLIVLVSECVSSALSAEAKSVPNAVVLVATLLFWTYTLDRLGRRWPWLQRRLEAPPVRLLADGKLLRENMAKEGVTEEELAAQLRQNGIADAAGAKAAYIEANGSVSVIPADDAPTAADLAEAIRRLEALVHELAAERRGPPGTDGPVTL